MYVFERSSTIFLHSTSLVIKPLPMSVHVSPKPVNIEATGIGFGIYDFIASISRVLYTVCLNIR